MNLQFNKMVGVRSTFLNLTLIVLVVSCRGQEEAVTAGPEEQPARLCTSPGQICATCDTVSICVANGDGTLTTVNQTCHSDEACVGGQCVKGALCNYRPFQCAEEGFFPDPYDCTKYHVCVNGLDAFSFQCPTGSSYDALGASCGYPLNTTACLDRPVPDCTQRLQIGGIITNPNLYYICVEKDATLAPELYKCPGGAPFKPEKFSCKEETKEPKEKKKSKKTKGKGKAE